MSSFATPPVPPHFHEHQRLSPSRSAPFHQHQPSEMYSDQQTVSSHNTSSNSRKRKASPSSEDDHEMSTSPQPPSNARLPPQQATSRKRARPNLSGRPLTVDRLLETLDKDALVTILRTMSDRSPQLKNDILHIAPRPSVDNTLQVLRQYLDRLRQSFPLDPNPRSDYSYDRIRPQWYELLDALTDFTPHFLAPNESQSSISLAYLDGVTQIISELPEWDTAQYNMAKQEAYESITRAWVDVITEASKRGGGIQLQHGGWETKLRMHNQKSGGLMQEAYDELGSALGWLRPQTGMSGVSSDRQEVRNQLLTGTYGIGMDQQGRPTHQQPPLNMRTGNW